MWSKIIELIFKYMGLPLITKAIEIIRNWWINKQALDKIEQEVDEAIKLIQDSSTSEEQKDALKKFVEGVRLRRGS